MDVITFPENRLTTSGLQIFLHGVISLPDATSYDKMQYSTMHMFEVCVVVRLIWITWPFSQHLYGVV